MGQSWVITEKCDGQLVYNKNAKLCDRLLGRSPSTLIQWQGTFTVLAFYGRFPPKELPKSTDINSVSSIWVCLKS